MESSTDDDTHGHGNLTVFPHDHVTGPSLKRLIRTEDTNGLLDGVHMFLV